MGLTVVVDIAPHDLVKISAQWVSQRWNHRPEFGIILGTGAGEVAKAIVPETIFSYRDIPHFPVSTALGHAGQLICGKLLGHSVVAMQGRFHLYEGYPVFRSTLGVRLLHELGCSRLIVTNAAGGVNPAFCSGDIMLIDSHIDLMFRRSQDSNLWISDRLLGRRSDQVYDREMAEFATTLARQQDFDLRRGVYVGMLGPNYETRAEYRLLRRIGGDTVGMSTIPEVCLAATLGMRVIGLSIVANVASPDDLLPTSGQEVIHFADRAAPRLRKLVEGLVQSFSSASSDSKNCPLD